MLILCIWSIVASFSRASARLVASSCGGFLSRLCFLARRG